MARGVAVSLPGPLPAPLSRGLVAAHVVGDRCSKTMSPSLCNAVLNLITCYRPQGAHREGARAILHGDKRSPRLVSPPSLCRRLGTFRAETPGHPGPPARSPPQQATLGRSQHVHVMHALPGLPWLGSTISGGRRSAGGQHIVTAEPPPLFHRCLIPRHSSCTLTRLTFTVTSSSSNGVHRSRGSSSSGALPGGRLPGRRLRPPRGPAGSAMRACGGLLPGGPQPAGRH